MGILDSFEQGVEMQIKIVTLLVLSATFLCLVSCGGSNQSEIAIPATGQEISGESEATTPLETSPSQVATNEGIPEVPESPPSANPDLEEGISTSLSSTTNLPPSENPREWPEDVGSNHIGALGNSLDGVDGAWIRPLPGRFIWGLMDPEKGKYLWMGTDRWVSRWQENRLGVLVMVWPFAQWDQNLCHGDEPAIENPREFAGLEEGLFVRMYPPCDLDAYTAWLRSMVERYDGDGEDDMPGLKYPLRHWEIGNEPDMQSSSHTLFQGSASDYLELLKLSYSTIKSADPEAQVLIAAPSKFTPDVIEFWEPILEGGSDYFDIGNMHSLQGSSDFHASDYRRLLDDSGSIDKPFWVTEAGVFMGGKALAQEELSRVTIPNYASAFANGAEVLFRLSRGHSSGKVLDAYLLAARTFGQFIDVARLSENVIQFDMAKERSVFVLWDNGKLPESVTGQVTVITYEGQEVIIDASAVTVRVPTVVIVESFHGKY